MTTSINDSEWIKDSFMLPKFAANLVDYKLKTQSSAAFKFTDTTLGGNFAINPPPQYTSWADLKVKGRYNPSKGQGRKYSEQFDDNSQLIHIRAGTTQFNSMTGFFTSVYDGKAGYLARTGRAPGWFYDIGRVTGFVVTLPLAPFIYAGGVVNFFLGSNSSQYCYLKPTMPLYWNAVNTIANSIAVAEGIVPRVWSTPENQATDQKLNSDEAEEAAKYTIGEYFSIDNEYGPDDIKRFYKLDPKIYTETGGIDVYAVANKAQRLANDARKKMQSMFNGVTSHEDIRARAASYAAGNVKDKATNATLDAYLEAWSNVSASQPAAEGDTETPEEAGSWMSDFFEFSAAELNDGGQFVTFRVNSTGAASASFSTSTKESGLSANINGASASARDIRFDLADGNVGGGLVGDAITGAIGAAKDLAMGVLDAVQLSGIAALAGNAFVDIPEQVDQSTTELNSLSYSLELRTPYGHPMARFKNLWIPTAMLIALALPRATGKHSYYQPFVLEIYDKGRGAVRYGVIDSMNISWGEGNIGFTRDKKPLGINIDFTIKDLSSVLHMPINSSPGIFDQDSKFNDMISVFGSLGLADQTYQWNKLKLNLTRTLTDWSSWSSPSHAASWIGGTVPGRLLSALARPMDRN